MRFWVISVSMLCCAALTANAQIQLKADSATTKEVRVSWTGAAGKKAQLERQASADRWDPVGDPADSAASDTHIAAYATYNYRVRAGAAMSNTITVGPPPAGFHLIQPRPEGHPDTSYGRFVSPVLDANGDPAIAYVYNDPNNDGRNDDTQLLFVSWDRAAYRWKQPVIVATIGQFDARPPMPCLSATRDDRTGAYGLAWIDSSNKVLHLATSRDGGATWTEKPILTGTRVLSGPMIVFAGGWAHLTVASDGHNTVLYRAGSLNDDPSSWGESPAPLLPGHIGVTHASWLAVDRDGVPGIAYWQRPASGNVYTLAYWQPGKADVVKVADTASSGQTPDGVQLAYFGVEPRIVMDVRLDRAQTSTHYAVKSADGVTWTKPAMIPDDGNEHLGGYMSVAIAPNGSAAFAGDVLGGNTGGMKCSWPKLARTRDFATWDLCAPQGSQYPQIRTLWGSVLFAPEGMLYMVFQNRQITPAQGLPAGLVIWGGK